jgi:hypothetical protein
MGEGSLGDSVDRRMVKDWFAEVVAAPLSSSQAVATPPPGSGAAPLHA